MNKPIKPQPTRNDALKTQDYYLSTDKSIQPFIAAKGGTANMVTKDNFPALDGVTCYTLELWEECMRIPHWHPNAYELGYVISGSIEIIIWRSPGETAVFTLKAGMCWFIPKAALHSLNNVGKERARLLVGFSVDRPQDIDLPVAFNGLPAAIRDAYTTPHKQLRTWMGVKANPILGPCDVQPAIHSLITGSPYCFDLLKATPLFNDPRLGSVVWAVKSNWGILEDISILRAILKPGVARDPIWYPDAGTLYVVGKGKGQFNLIMAEHETVPIEVGLRDYIYVPSGVLHTFSNTGTSEDFEVLAFFTQANPQPEVSLSVATAFFPNSVRRAAMTEFAGDQKTSDPLKEMNFTDASPYLLKVMPAHVNVKAEKWQEQQNQNIEN